MTNPQLDNVSAIDIARSLFRHTKKALAVFLIVVTATLCWIIFSPDEYESVAKIYVRVGRENTTLDPSATTGQTVNIEQTLESQINSMLLILGSRETAGLVVANVGVEPILANDLPDGSSQASSSSHKSSGGLKSLLSSIKKSVLPTKFSESRDAKAAREILKRSSFSAPKKSNVIEISCRAGNPMLAQLIAKAWTDAFIEEHLRVTKTEGSMFFFVHQTEKLKEQLTTAEEDLKEARSASNLVSVEGQRLILEDQAKSIRTRALSNNSMLESAQAKIKELSNILQALPSRVDTDMKTAQAHEGWYKLREKLFDLQIKEQELKSKYSNKHADVIAVVQQREQIEKTLATQNKTLSESTSSPNPTYRMFQESLLNEQAQVVSLIAEKYSLEKQLAENLTEFKALNESAVSIGELERQLKILETSYVASAEKMEQAKIIQGLQTAKISSLNELQSASFDPRPTGMGNTKQLLMGVIFGLFCAIGVAGVAEYFDRSFVTATQAENALDLPVLVSIPQSRRQFLEIG